MKVTIKPIVIVGFRTVTKGLVQDTGRIGNKSTNGDHPNYCIIGIGQNTEKSPADLRTLAVTQTPVEDHQTTLVWKILKG